MRLLSNDGTPFDVSTLSARRSRLLACLLEEEEGNSQDVPLLSVDTATLACIVRYLEEPDPSSLMWMREFISGVAQRGLLGKVKNAANYLDLGALHDACIQGESVVDFRNPVKDETETDFFA